MRTTVEIMRPVATSSTNATRDLGDQEPAAEAVVLRATGRFAARILERVVRRVHRRVHRRHETHGDAAENRDAEREEDDHRIERDLLGAWHEIVADVREERQRRGGESESEDAAAEREQEALGEELRHDPTSLRAERETDADFLAPAREAREQKVRDVRAGDQQHRRDRDEQHRVGLALVADEILLQEVRVQLRLRVDVGRMRLRVAGRDHIHRGARFGEADAGFQAREHVVEETAVVDLLLRKECRFVRTRREYRHLVQRKSGGALWQHADDRVGLAVQRQRLADDVGASREMLLPVAVAQERDRRGAGLVFLGEEIAAEHRLHAKHREIVLRDDKALQLLRIARAGRDERVRRRHRNVGEHLLAFAHREHARPRDRRRRKAAIGQQRLQLHDAAGVRVRQRAQEDRLDHAEDRAVGADAEREREDRDEREDGRLGEGAERESERVHWSGISASGRAAMARPPSVIGWAKGPLGCAPLAPDGRRHRRSKKSAMARARIQRLGACPR